jgi:hypothetical protein
MKQCSHCQETKPDDHFETRRSVCRPCRRTQMKVRLYGIDVETYNKMFSEQRGCCAICGVHQSEFDKSLAIDHDHVTGKVRGLLCILCNTALGKFKDDKNLLSAAIRYLDAAES